MPIMKRILPVEFSKTQAIAMKTLTLVHCMVLAVAVRAADAPKVFSTPEAAVTALKQATTQNNPAAFTALFGSASQDLANPDPVQGENEVQEFAAAFNTS